MKKLFKIILVVATFGIVAHAFAGGLDSALVTNTLEGAGTTTAFAAVAKKELAERELIKHFRHSGTWLERVPSKNQWVGNDVIKLNEIGADPSVLINNSTYPIAVAQRTDTSTAISLFKYDTTNTKITDDELYGLPYDKPGSVQQQHRETLEERTQEHALHSLAPVENSASTPIISTTGVDDGTGRLRLTSSDLINYKKTLDNLKIPKKGRVLVLCSDHVADLLLEDKALNVQYQNHTTGAIAKNYYGFEIYEDIYSPEYDENLDKIPFASETSGTKASVLFLAQRTAKARGSVKRYMGKAEDNPENRETVVGFRLYFIAIPTSLLGQGAIVSGITPEEDPG
ncbi:hypothetical protein MC378_10400 [Polaribacter sp. MSW13]|uniref:Major capsid protein n=1 Tax=Polaribacter marinus TaxID=2916838 RepID=A0A9X1VP00_9FLAO|nr:hypothetical protein [Polaribacter marinus]MCI2229578.1 hypothetical protein [Polaribacter marinus]